MRRFLSALIVIAVLGAGLGLTQKKGWHSHPFKSGSNKGLLIAADHVAGLFGDHDCWRIGVGPDQAGHDGTVADANAVQPPHAQLRIDHRHVVGPHLAGAGRMV